MAKTPKVKKREVSFRSRAARRGASPPVKDAPANAKPAVKETEYKPWLHNAQNAGISKKQKVKPLKRQQKVRQAKAMEKADAVVDKLERKVADSKARSKRIQSRAKAWEELNEQAVLKKTVIEAKVEEDATAAAEKDEDEVKMDDVTEPEPENTIETTEDVNVDPAPASNAAASTEADVEVEVDEVT
ncbi:hypothetical protein LTR56_016074 [Elasticomyces elasticus]|nr:hypothetical protein LTR56_016074 [Elasticomyces elasticus]KAK3653806.1 hypothetical protein LTR22_011021 [Elasticomyces elasticus]KAK4916008.1 hypothetical protein LTR49_015919 [Elasticomyces elasticus]KAK5755390.1 hypothetical protein LTS12_014497 [Elasticomyces elasticus]